MKCFLTCLSSEIRNLKKLIYFLFLMGNAGNVCVSTCVSVETHTLSVWVQTDLDATPPSNRDFTFLYLLRHISPKNLIINLGIKTY